MHELVKEKEDLELVLELVKFWSYSKARMGRFWNWYKGRERDYGTG